MNNPTASSSARKRKTNAFTRIQWFSEDFDALAENILQWKFCAHTVEWDKKSIVVDHVFGGKHLDLKRKAGNPKIQSSIDNSLNKLEKKAADNIWFCRNDDWADMSLEKKDKMEDWLKTCS